MTPEMGMLDQPRLAVTLSPKDATYGLKEWPVTCDARTVGMVRRSRGLGSVFSGMRHRLSQRIVDGDGTVLCVVDRSAALKGDVSTYEIRSPGSADSSDSADSRAGQPLGWITRKSIEHDDGGKRTYRELSRAVARRGVDGVDRIDRDGAELLGSLAELADEPPTTYGFHGAGDEWATVRLRRKSGRGGWNEATVWTLGGMHELTPDDRLLVVAVALVAEPWHAGETAAARRSQKQSDALFD